MTIEITANFDLEDDIRLIQNELERELAVALQDEQAEIKTKTLRGVDFQGRRFKPYSKAYAQKRLKAGRNSQKVDLTFTGRMLANMTSRVRDQGGELVGEIGFASATEAAKASSIEADGREFMNLEDSQVERVRGRLVQAINKE